MTNPKAKAYYAVWDGFLGNWVGDSGKPTAFPNMLSYRLACEVRDAFNGERRGRASVKRFDLSRDTN